MSLTPCVGPKFLGWNRTGDRTSLRELVESLCFLGLSVEFFNRDPFTGRSQRARNYKQRITIPCFRH